MDTNTHLTLFLNNGRSITGNFIEMDDSYILMDNAYFDNDESFVFTIKFNINYISCKTTFGVESDEETLNEEEVYDEVMADLRKCEEKEYVGENMELGNVPEGYDQIKENERKYGIKFTYNENEYTSPLDRNSDFFRDNVEAAMKIEREILKNKKERCDERFKDENDSKYSDVVRRRNRNSYYRNGGKRKEKEANDTFTNNSSKTNVEKHAVKGKGEFVQPGGNNRRKEELVKDKYGNKGSSDSKKDVSTKYGYSGKLKNFADKKFNRSESFDSIRAKPLIADSKAKETNKVDQHQTAKIETPQPVKKKEPFSWSSINLDLCSVKPKSDKRITYGKPTQSKYEKLDEAVEDITSKFTHNKEMKKKWSSKTDSDTKSFLSYTEEKRKYSYKK